MLRILLVYLAAAVGMFYALQGPFYALLFYTWNAYFRPESWVWDYTADWVMALRLSLISGWLTIVVTFLAGKKFIWNGRCTLLLVFLTFTYISTLRSVSYDFAFRFWADFAKALVVTYLYIVLVTDVAKLRLLILVMALSLGLEGAKQGLVTMVFSPGSENINRNLFLGDNNGVAIGMLMLVPMFGLLAQTTAPGKKWRRRAFWILALGVLYRAISTYSRGAMLAAVALLSVYWWRSKHKIRGLVVVGAVGVVILSVMPQEWWTRMETTFNPRETNEQSALSRIHFWKVAIDMADDNPVLGVGFNSYNLAYDDYDFGGGLHSGERSVHSSWFGVLSELGYFGAFLYGLVFLCSVRACRRARKKAKEDPRYEELARYATAVQTALVPVLVGGAFVIFHYNEMLWNFFGLTMVINHFITTKTYEEIYSDDVAMEERAEEAPAPTQPVLEGV